MGGSLRNHVYICNKNEERVQIYFPGNCAVCDFRHIHAGRFIHAGGLPCAHKRMQPIPAYPV